MYTENPEDLVPEEVVAEGHLAGAPADPESFVRVQSWYNVVADTFAIS
jgi:hypothetical protein